MMLAATARRLYLTNLYSCKLALCTCLHRQSSQHTSGNRACERIHWNTQSISGCTQISGTRVRQMWVNTHAIFPACILPLSLLIWCSLRLAPMIYILLISGIFSLWNILTVIHVTTKLFVQSVQFKMANLTIFAYTYVYVFWAHRENCKIKYFNKNIKYIIIIVRIFWAFFHDMRCWYQ